MLAGRFPLDDNKSTREKMPVARIMAWVGRDLKGYLVPLHAVGWLPSSGSHCPEWFREEDGRLVLAAHLLWHVRKIVSVISMATHQGLCHKDPYKHQKLQQAASFCVH